MQKLKKPQHFHQRHQAGGSQWLLHRSDVDPFKPLINEWIEEDPDYRRKDRRTTKEMYEIPVSEHGFQRQLSAGPALCEGVQTESDDSKRLRRWLCGLADQIGTWNSAG